MATLKRYMYISPDNRDPFHDPKPGDIVGFTVDSVMTPYIIELTVVYRLENLVAYTKDNEEKVRWIELRNWTTKRSVGSQYSIDRGVIYRAD